MLKGAAFNLGERSACLKLSVCLIINIGKGKSEFKSAELEFNHKLEMSQKAYLQVQK